METVKRKITDFSIAAILTNKRTKFEDQDDVKQEKIEGPSSTILDRSFSSDNSLTSPSSSCQSPSISCSSSSSTSPATPVSHQKFPGWTQCQKDTRKSRRPYSRHTVSILSWWFHHLPFLTVEEMETVAMITSLTRQQVKVWWQNRRHSQRGRQPGEADPYTSHIHHLPTYHLVLGHGQVPEPGTGARGQVFRNICTFFYAWVLPSMGTHY